MKKLAAIALTLLSFCAAAQQYPTETIITEQNSVLSRAILNTEVFGCGGIPATVATVVTNGEWESIPFVTLSTGAKFFSNTGSKLVIFHAGHNQDAINQDAGGPIILDALERGFDVLALNMPTGDHARFAQFDYPLTAFMTPVAESLNYTLSTNTYTDIIMSGLSGGGWSTVVYAAMDERITHSYPVAGSWPKYLRYSIGNNKSIGDYEQTLPNITASYLDLYALATSNGRIQHQIFNSNDPCCFEGYRSTEYEGDVDAALSGEFSVTVVNSNTHSVPTSEFNTILGDYDAPEQPELVAHTTEWYLGSGPVLQTSTGQNQGTIYGSVAYGNNSVTMSNDYATVPDAPNLRIGANPYNIKIRVGFTGSSYGVAFGKFEIFLPYSGATVLFNFPSAGRIQFRDKRGAGFEVSTNSVNLNDGVVRDYEFKRVISGNGVGTLEIWIDGTLDSQTVMPSVTDLTTTNQMFILSRPDANQYVNGTFEKLEFTVYR